MKHILTILWAGWLYAAIVCIHGVSCEHAMTMLFPEGRRWWHLPLFLGALTHFALVVIFNPWSYL